MSLSFFDQKIVFKDYKKDILALFCMPLVKIKNLLKFKVY